MFECLILIRTSLIQGPSQKRVLHVTPWYPTHDAPDNAVWIKRHIESLQPHCLQQVLHVDVDWGALSYHRTSPAEGVTRIRVRVPIKIWRLREWVSAWCLFRFLHKAKAHKNFDVINLHIAYPMGIHLKRMKRWLPTRTFITEHWSYYHFHFYSKKQLKRVKDMFRTPLTLIAVSNALGHDMEVFAGMKLPYQVLPNVVDTQVFLRRDQPLGDHYFMAALWKKPKNPLSVLQALQVLKENGTILHVRIGGYGPLWEQMKEQATQMELQDQLTFLGRLNSEEMASEFNSATAFILPSEYETFSVVCAEALCCGCPVLSEPIGAIPELVTPGMGLIRESEETWSSLLGRFINHAPFNRNEISRQAADKFSITTIGARYAAMIDES